ncbi:OmpH family outer membrane protein [Caulobacter sp. S45]|uniref:OmpH family outer membrane protein n=1 Tax=Caulobacter sp. S45 TaxID=1641861 RepID=UPI00131AB969|nr:OmpH family outer membrane protein [Caulobacter sp. S45]
MIMKNIVTGAATAALMLAAAAGANAQSKKSATTSSHTAAAAAAPAASEPPLNHGPAIAGICFYSNNIAMGTSVVGKAMAERMQQLRAQAAAELSAEQTSLQNDEKALAAKRSTMSPDQFAQQAQPMGQREQALNQKADTRTRELQATYAHQQQRIGVVVEPIVRTIYEQRHCSVLLNGEAVMAGNPAMDLTEEVVKGLNAKMTTITFDRESAPAQ